jgi:hypothetical protein
MRIANMLLKTTTGNMENQATILTRGGMDVASMEWEWSIRDSYEKHSERAALLRPILYEMTVSEAEKGNLVKEGKALSLNISSGGMLVLMDQAPDIEQVLKIYVPTPITIAETPTLAEVRWTRKLPIGDSSSHVTYFVGLKFMF